LPLINAQNVLIGSCGYGGRNAILLHADNFGVDNEDDGLAFSLGAFVARYRILSVGVVGRAAS